MKHYRLAQVLRLFIFVGVCALLCFGESLYAQQDAGTLKLPQGHYVSPVSHPIKVSGTFGELRGDHFHMGLDIKSAKGASGDPILAVADGFISRIRVSAAGYGNALYIDHSNGTRSVYAHLDAFSPEIQHWLDSVHYKKESFELDEELSPKQFVVKAGQMIGKLGNTGSSQGPHLHFELRLSANDAGINPQLFGIPITDRTAPSLRGLSIYRYDAAGVPRHFRTFNLVAKGNKYSLSSAVSLPPGPFSIGIKAYDRQEGTSNLNGVYRIEALEDGVPYWQHSYDTVSFEETRYIQAHYDYASKARGNGYFYRLHRLPGDKLGIYERKEREGMLSLAAAETKILELRVTDTYGNLSTLNFQVQAGEELPALNPGAFNFMLRHDQSSQFELGDASVKVPAGAVYAPTYLDAGIKAAAAIALSRCYELGSDEEPLQVPVLVRLPLEDVPVQLRSKAYAASCTGLDLSSLGKRVDCDSPDFLCVELKNWANLAVFIDTVGPSITRMDRYNYRLSDKATARRWLRYRVSQQGQYVLASFDAKSGRLEIRRDKLAVGALRIEAWDELGNRSVLDTE